MVFSRPIPGSSRLNPVSAKRWASKRLEKLPQTVLVNRMCNLDMFEDHFCKALTQLHRDGASTARLFFYCVRPWVSGASLRIAMFERVLDHALALDRVWTPTAGEVVQAWKAATRKGATHD